MSIEDFRKGEILSPSVKISQDLLEDICYSTDILIIGGYANAGKTSLITELKSRMDVRVVSLSEVCHNILKAWIGQKANTKDPVIRQQFINFVEEGLMRNIGRANMVKAAMLPCDKNYLVIIETIGGEELSMFLDAIPPRTRIQAVNVRSSREQPGIDNRVLIPDCYEFWWEKELVVKHDNRAALEKAFFEG